MEKDGPLSNSILHFPFLIWFPVTLDDARLIQIIVRLIQIIVTSAGRVLSLPLSFVCPSPLTVSSIADVMRRPLVE